MIEIKFRHTDTRVTWTFEATPLSNGDHVITGVVWDPADEHTRHAGTGEANKDGMITRGLSAIPARVRELLEHHLYLASEKGYRKVYATILPNGDRGVAEFTKVSQA